jgi:hypothetical protein
MSAWRAVLARGREREPRSVPVPGWRPRFLPFAVTLGFRPGAARSRRYVVAALRLAAGDSEAATAARRRHVYAKLGVHSRHEAVDRARALGLLAPLARRA